MATITRVMAVVIAVAAVPGYGIDPYERFGSDSRLRSDYGSFGNYDIDDFAWGYGPYDYYDIYEDWEESNGSFREDIYGDGDFYEDEYGIFNGEDLNGDDDYLEDGQRYSYEYDFDDWADSYYTEDWYEYDDSFSEWYRRWQGPNGIEDNPF